MLALEAGEDSAWEWLKFRERCEVTGPWPAFEQRVADVVLAGITDYDGAQIVDHDGERWLFVTEGCGPDELMGAPVRYRGEADSGAWARVRVRVSVEVLDGVL